MPLSFALPFGIVLSAIVIGSAAVYFLNERRQVTRDFIVPYVEFCKPMRRPINNPRGLPRWLILFILQLLALFFLVGAISQCHPRSSAPERKGVAIILDCSRSMKAKDGRTTRFENARKKALSLLDKSQASNFVTVIAASANLTQFDSQWSKEELREAIRNLNPVDTGTDLERALDMAQTSLFSSGHIHLLTDRGREVYEHWHQKYGESHQPVTIHIFGKDADNVAIVGFNMYQSLFAGDYSEVGAYLTIQSYAKEGISTKYRILLEGVEVAAGRCSLEPMAQETFVFKGFNRPGLVTAEIDFDDALPQDNRAYALIRPIRPLRYLVVSESETLQQQLKDEFSALQSKLQFDHKYFAEITSASSTWSYDGVILDFAPFEMEQLELPAVLWNGGYEASFQQDVYYWIVDWNEKHELMRYLENFNLPRIHVAGQMPKAEWLHPVIEGRLGTDRQIVALDLFPVVAAGTKSGRRSVYFGFDLAAYPLRKYQHLKILLLNALKWLHPYSRVPASIQTGSPYFLTAFESTAPILLTTPDGEKVEFSPETRMLPGALLSQIGPYRVASGAFEHEFVANLFDDPKEFDLTVDAERRWTSEHKSVRRKIQPSSRDLSLTYKAWNLVLILLMLELILYVVFSYREARLGLSKTRRR